MKYTAIFGGTFNPPHIGHYEMVSELEKIPDIGEIWLTPTKIPPHKVCDFLASDSDRIKMCEIVAEDFPKAKVCTREFERDGKSYTYDTVTLLKEEYKEKNFAFVCGGDMVTSFDGWYNYEELMKMLKFYAFRRTDTKGRLFDEKVEKFRNMGMDITVIETNITDVSSTYIRNNINKSEKLLTKKIFDFIKTEGIYSAEQQG